MAGTRSASLTYAGRRVGRGSATFDKYTEIVNQAGEVMDEDEQQEETTPPESAEQETPQEWSLPTVGRAATRSGSLIVETTEQGLPRTITIEPSELDQPASALARRILGLCRQAALQAGLRRREELVAAGVDIETLSYLGLPTADDVLAAEDEADDQPPETWMRRV